jgi:hypothetical protein
MSAYGLWQYRVDEARTAESYARASQGDAERCGCSFCRNFIAARDVALPREFWEFLVRLGIDPLKDGEVYHEGRLAPGNHCYGGWYHFVGELTETGDFPPVKYPNGFIAYMCRKSAPHLVSLDGLPVVQIEFRAQNVPWVISDEEPM